MYIGEFQFRKTQRKSRKGKIRTRFTTLQERIVTQHPELAIIDRDLWDRNQARLAKWIDRPFYAKKKVEYLFTGKVFCGWCKSTCIVSDGKFLCTGRQQKGICTNSRRVWREAVEESVLGQIKGHLLTTELLEPCISAYREEAQRALAEHADRAQSDTTRLNEVDQRIANLITQLSAAGEATFTSQIVIGEIDRLGAEKTRLENLSKFAPRPVGPALDSATIVERIGATLDDLQQALEGDDREAARARELVRGLVDKLVLSPTPGSDADGRGAGDMTVTVEGPLASLIDLADLPVNRVAKHEHRPMFVLDNATPVYRFSYVLEWRDPRLTTVYADLVVASQLLDESDVPVTMKAFAEALPSTAAGKQRDRPVNRRAQNAVAYLKAHGLVRCINTRSVTTGYIWADPSLSDEQRKAHIIVNPPMTGPKWPIRATGPAATAVVIGTRGEVEGARCGL